MAEKTLLGRFADISETMAQKVAEEIVENPKLMNAVARAMGAKQRIDEASQTALAAMNIPTANEFDELRTKVRLLTRRIEQLENAGASTTAATKTPSKTRAKSTSGSSKRS